MPVDRLIKALPTIKHQTFIKQLHLVNIESLIRDIESKSDKEKDPINQSFDIGLPLQA